MQQILLRWLSKFRAGQMLLIRVHILNCSSSCTGINIRPTATSACLASAVDLNTTKLLAPWSPCLQPCLHRGLLCETLVLFFDFVRFLAT